MSEESKKGIYNQSSFDAIKLGLIGTKPKYPATPLENRNDAPGRRDAQFENHWSNYSSWHIYRFTGPVLYTGGLCGGHCNNKKLVIREQTSNPAII